MRDYLKKKLHITSNMRIQNIRYFEVFKQKTYE